MENRKGRAFAGILSIVLIAIFTVAPIGHAWAQNVDLNKTYNWKMTSAMSTGQDGNKSIVEFVKLLEQRTKGKVKISLYEGTLGSPTDAWDMVKNNAVQFTFTSDLYNAARMPILGMVGLPMEYPSQRAVLLTTNEWLKQGYLKELTDNFKVLFFLSTHPLTVFLRNKKVATMDDFKGLKIRCGGPAQSQGVALLGATGVSMPGGEQYMALQTGVIDGAISGIDMALDRKFYEITKYAPSTPIYFGIYVLLMNKDTWNGLPAELQKLIEQTSNEISASELTRRMADEKNLWNTFGQKVEVYKVSKEEEGRWRKATASVADKYVKDMEAKGYPAKGALEVMRKVNSKER
ncbi:MAG TPA: TRAP transporter substrate-binding protein DctP [Syntrophorhabdaceae bacterium]|nr:TRAP transporter substrate-binding protein DctP [Syntrophorhabdaceae bacterium]